MKDGANFNELWAWLLGLLAKVRMLLGVGMTGLWDKPVQVWRDIRAAQRRGRVVNLTFNVRKLPSGSVLPVGATEGDI